MLASILAVVGTFAILVLVHEFGHLLTAKMFGISVKEFAVGFGPKLFSRFYGETEYSLRAIPLGGFNDIEIDNEKKEEHDFCGKPLWKRLVVLFAGSGFNFLSAYIAFFLFFLVFGVATPTNVVADIAPDKVVASYFQKGDKILSVNGKEDMIPRHRDTVASLESLVVKVDRDGEILTFDIAKEAGSPLGVILTAEYRPVPFEKLFSSSWIACKGVFKLVYDSIGAIVSQEVAVTEAIAGPVGVSSIVYQASENEGIKGIVIMFAVLSINLGMMNLFPIPCLDGGHILIQTVDTAVEKIFRRGFSKTVIEYVSYAGASILGAIFILGLFADFLRFS